jgi:cell wall-associated NlpC family hydrolase
MTASSAGTTTLVLFAIMVGLAASAGGPPADPPSGRQAADWAARGRVADGVLLDAAGIAAFNRRMLDVDPSVRDLAALPATLAMTEVATLVGSVSRPPGEPLILDDDTDDGILAGPADRDRWTAMAELDAHPAQVTPRFALVTRRASLRRLPTTERVRRPGGPTDIDLFQESAFFPGTPVAAIHATADGQWAFVLGTTYAAWIETSALAFADRATVLDYARRSTQFVTAARATAVPLDAPPEAAGVALDMGTALPPGRGVEGGGPAVELPVRATDGSLVLVVARVEPAAAVHEGPLPASRRQVLEQAFRFLGEPYGWGHDHDARDCSGFVCDVYHSLGILLPRNTRDQAASPALDLTVVDPDWPRDRRLATIARLRPGDLVYAPRHVMMIVGHDDSGPWVIHDTHAGRLAGDPADAVAHGVVVAPLARILADDGGLIVDTVTTLVRVLPSPCEQHP